MHQPRSRRRPKFNSVEEYLASLDPTKERTLRSVIDLILTQFPEPESKISWNVPTIHRNGKYVVGVCAYKHHLTFSPWSSRVIEDFKVRLGKFVLFKNSRDFLPTFLLHFHQANGAHTTFRTLLQKQAGEQCVTVCR